MKISTKGRYALKVMMDIALHDNGEFISLKDITSRQNITVKYLEQIVSGLNKSVVVVGSEKALESITEADISVEIDISDINITAGQTTSVPANVTVKSSNCWIYGTYTVEVSL
jgi:hypothetical protein